MVDATTPGSDELGLNEIQREEMMKLATSSHVGKMLAMLWFRRHTGESWVPHLVNSIETQKRMLKRSHLAWLFLVVIAALASVGQKFSGDPSIVSGVLVIGVLILFASLICHICLIGSLKNASFWAARSLLEMLYHDLYIWKCAFPFMKFDSALSMEGLKTFVYEELLRTAEYIVSTNASDVEGHKQKYLDSVTTDMHQRMACAHSFGFFKDCDETHFFNIVRRRDQERVEALTKVAQATVPVTA